MGPMLRKLGGFALLPLIGVASPFLLLPIVARVGGPDQWTAFGVGQSLGVIGSVFTLWGWWILGPARLSRATSPTERYRLFARSLQQRAIAFVIIAPIVAVIAAALTWEGTPVTAALMAIAVSAAGLTASWYSIGEGRPGQMVLFEDVPRTAALVASAGIILATGAIWIYPILLLVVSIAMPVLFARRLTPTFLQFFDPIPTALREMRNQATVASTNLLGTLYTATPVPIATQVSPIDAAAAFVSAEKIYRLGTFTIKALANALQSWVLEDSHHWRKRHLSALAAHSALGILGGALIATLTPFVTTFLFGSNLAATHADSLWFGVAFLFLSLSTPLTRNVLVPAGRTRITLIAGSIGATMGLALMLVSGSVAGTAGVAFGLAFSQAAIFAILIIPAIRWLRTGAGSSAAHTSAFQEE